MGKGKKRLAGRNDTLGTLRVVTVSAPFDPLPPGTPKDVMTFVIPIDFRLAGS